MPDREKVLGHLYDCVLASRPENMWVFVRKDIVGDAIALLKYQEPVKPVQRSDGTFCGWCGTVLPATFMCLDGQVENIRNDYCIHCGRAVKWE